MNNTTNTPSPRPKFEGVPVQNITTISGLFAIHFNTLKELMPSLNNHFFKPRPKVKERMINMATFTKYQKKNGEIAWQFSAYLGINPETGKSIKTTRRGFKNKKAAQLELAKLQAEFDAVEWTEKVIDEPTNDYTKKEYTFEDVYRLWYDSRSPSWKEASRIVMENFFNYHILPKYGNMNIENITTVYGQKVINEWAKTSKSYTDMHSLAVSVIEYAVMLELIASNKLAYVKVPKNQFNDKKETLKFYTHDELNVMLDKLKDYGNTYSKQMLYAIIRLLAYSGMRVSEALALTWDDIDFEQNKVNIDKTVTRIKGGITIGPTKTIKSNCKLIIDIDTMNILKKWQLYQKKYFFKLGSSNKNLVFCNREAKLHYTSTIYGKLETFCKKYNLEFKGIHALRHSHATILLESGASIKDIQQRLRHADIATTLNVYSHVSNTQQQNTVDRFSAYMSAK